jgi:hypothetical protein
MLQKKVIMLQKKVNMLQEKIPSFKDLQGEAKKWILRFFQVF